MHGGHFRPSVWDPLLTIAQIITVQSLFYSSLGILTYIVDCVFGHDPTLHHIFNYSDITVRTWTGLFIILCYLVNALAASFYLWYIVKRAKSCLDHSATIHITHFISCWIINSFPSTMAWWILNIICASITCILGEYLCMKTELKSIPLLSKSEV